MTKLCKQQNYRTIFTPLHTKSLFYLHLWTIWWPNLTRRMSYHSCMGNKGLPTHSRDFSDSQRGVGGSESHVFIPMKPHLATLADHMFSLGWKFTVGLVWRRGRKFPHWRWRGLSSLQQYKRLLSLDILKYSCLNTDRPNCHVFPLYKPARGSNRQAVRCC